ncbi:phage-shock protein [Alkalispirochaeta odontotermitis]|nr:phage-shock protein [Alkalispirochaeta odontotermitis]
MKNYDGNSHGGVYRSRSGVIFGVCRGLAEHFDFSVFWARTIAVIFLLVSGFWPAIGLYLIATLLLKPAPVVPLETEAEQEFYDSYTHSRRMAARRLKRRFENLERRLQRMEHIVTAREFDWDSKLKE